MEKIYYPYSAFREDLKILTQKVDQPFEVLLPISRGGLSMGQMLGEFYDIREVYAINTIGYDDSKKLDEVKVFNIPILQAGQRVLILDDIVDSGDTLVEVLKVLKTKYPETTFESASIFYKPTAIIEPTWWVKEAKGWIEFFWSEDLKKD
ncbi:MAG: Putative nucleotide phosphoribosyltransferase [uncultured Sulfurovum sp.]|uniref:Nucleotide phosphoribosyltransferase n=1 Tax=uncultured Sulfurovum sp. TaxID=269237 RepID=A0A6S6U3Y3_9BACT|nr:MAG: Putative nucleotide phosphoribosyltransferase [uncultured Sulfurovum sp.]